MYLQSICEILKLKVRSSKNIPRSETKQARPSSLLLLSIGAAFFASASKTSIVSIVYAKVNSPNLSGLEHSLCSYTRGHDRGGEVRFLREERRPPLPLLSWTDSGMCEGATYGKVVPSRPSHQRSVSRRQSLNCFSNFGKPKAINRPRLLTEKQSLHVLLTYVRQANIKV